MTFCGTVHLFHICMRYFIQINMAVFASQLPMNRFCKHLAIDIKDPLITIFVIATHTGISMAKQAIFRVRRRTGLCERNISAKKTSKEL